LALGPKDATLCKGRVLGHQRFAGVVFIDATGAPPSVQMFPGKPYTAEMLLTALAEVLAK
jgi:hypothetical protein